MSRAAAARRPARIALAARTLQIAPDVWCSVLDDYAEMTVSEHLASPERRLDAFARAYRPHGPHGAPLPPEVTPCTCPVCGEPGMQPLLARVPGPLVYGRCAACSHGMLLAGGLWGGEPYAGASYYATRDADGVGYQDYAGEVNYREDRGERLLTTVQGIAGAPFANLLEVGSGYGFTRIAAERRGIRTGGVDVNAHACDEAERRYGMSTFAGTLARALSNADSGITPSAWDAVLYQFVLEHLADPAAELREAARALRAGGVLVLLVPSMEAVEIDVFGASYRSFRADHLHLFSRRSLARLLTASGFEPHFHETRCNVHLLGGILSEAELEALYASGRGPDLLMIARKIA